MINFFRKKGRAVWAAFLSGAVAPGVGQIYNRDYKRGILLLTLSIGSFYWFSSVLTDQLSVLLPGKPDTWVNDAAKFREALMAVIQKNPGMFISFYALMILTWLFAVIDAYISAKNYVSLPPLTHDSTSDSER